MIGSGFRSSTGSSASALSIPPGWRARAGAVLLAACLGGLPVGVHAQNYPARPIKLIVPYPAGGITDILPRIMGEWLTGKWGQPVIVDNRPGAAGNIGAEAAFKALA